MSRRLHAAGPNRRRAAARCRAAAYNRSVDVIFLGTPAFAVPALERLAATPGLRLRAVVCQPDRPAGRGGALQSPAVKQAALRLGLEVFQPEKIRGDDGLQWLAARQPEALAVVAYGQLLPPRVFELPRLGAINAHASLLPRYRGAAPIQWALARGERETGVTTMRINAGMDTGDMLLQRRLSIGEEETAPELSRRLAVLAAELLAETLLGLAQARLSSIPQDDSQASLAPRLKKEDGLADWQRPARELYNHWRGFQPWPGLYTFLRGERLSIHRCRILAEADAPAPPGTLLPEAKLMSVACAPGVLQLLEVQLEGRKPLSGEEFLRGARLAPGERLGS